MVTRRGKGLFGSRARKGKPHKASKHPYLRLNVMNFFLITSLLGLTAALPAVEPYSEISKHGRQAAPLVLQTAGGKLCPRRGCSSSSSSSSSTTSCSSGYSSSCITFYACSPCDAVQTVINRDNDLIPLINKHNFNAASVLVQPEARFSFLDEHNGICLRQGGPVKNMWLLYKDMGIFDIIQNVRYVEEDGSVEVRAVEVATYKDQSINVRDVTRVYTAKQGCDYKLNLLRATSFLCRTN